MYEYSLDYFSLMLQLFRARRNTKYTQERLDQIEDFLCDEMDYVWYRGKNDEEFNTKDLSKYLIAQEKDNTIFYHKSKEWIVGREVYSANLESWRSP